MTDLVARANFTDNGGTPATGLTLAEISFFLTEQDKSTGALTTIWDGTQNPTVEVTGLGAYTRILSTADLNANVYHFMAQYTGASVLDSNFVFGAVGEVEVDADALLDRADTVEVGLTLRGAFRLLASAMAGALSGAATTNVLIRNAVANSKTRIDATVDADGNRTAVTTDTT